MPKKKSPKKKKVARKPVVVDVAQPAGPIGRAKMPPKIDYRRLLKNKSTPSSVISYAGFNKNARPYDYAIGALRSRPTLNPLAYTTPTGPATFFASLGENADSAIHLANLHNAFNKGYGPSFEDYIRGNVVSNPLDRAMYDAAADTPVPPDVPAEPMQADEDFAQEFAQEQFAQEFAQEQYVPEYVNPVAPLQPNAPTEDHTENLRLQEELRMLREYVVNQYAPSTAIETQTDPPVSQEIEVQTEPEIQLFGNDAIMPLVGGSRAQTFFPTRIPPIRIKRRAGRSPEEDARYGDAAGVRIGDVSIVEA